MGWARVAVTTEDWAPLQFTEVECFDIDTGVPIDVQETDKGGIVKFTGLPSGQRFFFRVRARRTSTAVRSTIDPNLTRTFTGAIRIQILAQHPGNTCFDALVDPDDQFGSHTTIQAAIDDLKDQNTTMRIGILEGTYDENLVIPSNNTAFVFEACQLFFPDRGTETGSHTPRGLRVTVEPSSGIPLTIENLAVNAPVSCFGIRFKATGTSQCVEAGRGYARFKECWFEQLGTGHAIEVSKDNFLMENCYVQCTDESKKAVFGTSGGSVILRYNTIIGRVDVDVGQGTQIEGNGITADVADAVVELADSLAISDHYRVVNNYIKQKNASGDGLKLRASPSAATEEHHLVVGNEIEGSGGGTGVEVVSALGLPSVTITGNVIHDWATGIDTNGHNVAVSGNVYDDNTTDVTGGGGGGGPVYSGVTTITGDSVPGTGLLNLDDTGTDYAFILFLRSGVMKAAIGIWDTDGPAAPFGADDLYFSTYDGSWHDLMALANDGTYIKMTTTLQVDTINEYTADAGVTVEGVLLKDNQLSIGGDVVLSRQAAGQFLITGTGDDILWIGDSNYGFNFAGGNPQFVLDTNDYWLFTRASSKLEFLIGGTVQFGFASEIASFPRGTVYVGTDDVLRGTLILYGVGTGQTDGAVIRLHLSADYDTAFEYWGIDAFMNTLRFFSSDGVVVNVMTAGGQLQLPKTGSGAGILIGGDTQWYRNAANELRTPDDVVIDGTLKVGTVQTYTPTNVTTDRSYDADATTLDEVADVLGTLIVDLKSIGLIQ